MILKYFQVLYLDEKILYLLVLSILELIIKFINKYIFNHKVRIQININTIIFSKVSFANYILIGIHSC